MLLYKPETQLKNMPTQNRTIYSIIAVFALPLIFAGILSYSGYLGKLQNKGLWVERSNNLTELFTTPPAADQYRWYVLYPCTDQCPHQAPLHAGISTLGKKQTMAYLQPFYPDNLTNIGQDVLNTNHIYLANPQQQLLLQYPTTHIMDLVTDLKRLLKPIETHT